VQCIRTITLGIILLELLPLYIFILELCPEHNSISIQATDLKFHRQIDPIEKKCSAQTITVGIIPGVINKELHR